MSDEQSVQSDQVVSMEYTLKVDGEVIDTSEGQEPLDFLAGHHNVILGLENEMLGMKVGDSKQVILSPANGYGEYDDQAFTEVERSEFPDDVPIKPGLEMHLTDDDGEPVYARVASVNGDRVRLDFNHPLAGKELHFNVKVVGLRAATTEELEHGHAHGAGHDH